MTDQKNTPIGQMGAEVESSTGGGISARNGITDGPENQPPIKDVVRDGIVTLDETPEEPKLSAWQETNKFTRFCLNWLTLGIANGN